MSRSKHLEPISTDILAGHSPEIRGMVETLRSIILKTVPNAAEKAQTSWHSLNFSHPEAGYFCGIFPFEHEVKLIFEWGILLPDPDGLLQGDGKQVRLVLVRNKKDIQSKALEKLIRSALDLPQSRATKLGLIQSKAQPIGRK